METSRQKQRQAFKKALENHVAQKGPILMRFTSDKKFHVSLSPHLDLEWTYFEGMDFYAYFFPGNKMKCKYEGGKSYVAEYLGQFPSEEAAKQRIASIEAELKKPTKVERPENAGTSRKETKEKPLKKSKTDQELPGPSKPSYLMTFHERLRSGTAFAAHGDQRSSPLTPVETQELPDDLLSGSADYAELKAGCWMSQKDIVNEVGRQISANERSKQPLEIEILRQKTTDRYGFTPEENLVSSDGRRFRTEALASAPIILDDSPIKHQTTVLFPTDIFGKPGAPGPDNSIYALEKGETGAYDQLATVPSLPYRLPGVILDTQGPFPYVTKLLLPENVTDDLLLAQQKPPLFKDDIEWRTTDMSPESDYHIPTRRTQEKDFTLKNPPRVDRAAITLRDNVSKWFFQIGGAGKTVLDTAYPTVFVDDHVQELDRKMLSRQITLEKYIWYLMSRMLGGGAGLYRLSTVYEIAKRKDGKKRMNSFYVDTLGLEFFRAVEGAVYRKLRQIADVCGAPGTDAAVRQLPEVPYSFPAFFGHSMDSWMRGFRKRNEKTTGLALETDRNMESDAEDDNG